MLMLVRMPLEFQVCTKVKVVCIITLQEIIRCASRGEASLTADGGFPSIFFLLLDSSFFRPVSTSKPLCPINLDTVYNTAFLS